MLKLAIELGAKIVWFPTLSAKNHLDQMGTPDFGDSLKQKTKRRITEKPIYILNDKGHLVPEVYEVIDLIAEHDIVLATGHLSIPEAKHLVKAAKERRVNDSMRIIRNISSTEPLKLERIGRYGSLYRASCHFHVSHVADKDWD